VAHERPPDRGAPGCERSRSADGGRDDRALLDVRGGVLARARPGEEAQEGEPGAFRFEAYAPEAYARAVARACVLAGVPHWHPHQLRHNAATLLRRELGIEAARVVLGHSSAAVTEVYAEMDLAKAKDAVKEKLG